MSETPADWYPDPYGRSEHRYFDGTAWTDNVSTGGRQSLDPIAQAQMQSQQVSGVRGDGVGQQVEKHFANAEKRGAYVDREGGLTGGGLLDQQVFVVNQKAKLIEVNNEYAIFNRAGPGWPKLAP